MLLKSSAQLLEFNCFVYKLRGLYKYKFTSVVLNNIRKTQPE